MPTALHITGKPVRVPEMFLSRTSHFPPVACIDDGALEHLHFGRLALDRLTHVMHVVVPAHEYCSHTYSN
jgi:hypothetical protein